MQVDILNERISPETVLAIHKRMKQDKEKSSKISFVPLKQDYMNFVYAINTIEGGKRQIDSKIQGGTQFEFKSGTAMLEAAIF
jgi:hypothetical protein